MDCVAPTSFPAYMLHYLLLPVAFFGLLLVPRVSPPAEAVPLVNAAVTFEVKGKVVWPEGAEKQTLDVQLMKFNRGLIGGGGTSDMTQDSALERMRQKWKAVAKTRLTEDGTFTLKDIEEGSYQLLVGDPEMTMWAIKSVRIRGEDLEVGDIELQKPVEAEK